MHVMQASVQLYHLLSSVLLRLLALVADFAHSVIIVYGNVTFDVMCRKHAL